MFAGLRVGCEWFNDVHPADALSFHFLAVLLEIHQLVRHNPRLRHKSVLGRMRRRHSMTSNIYTRNVNRQIANLERNDAMLQELVKFPNVNYN